MDGQGPVEGRQHRARQVQEPPDAPVVRPPARLGPVQRRHQGHRPRPLQESVRGGDEAAGQARERVSAPGRRGQD